MSVLKSEWRVHSLIALCCVMVLPSPLFGQEHPASHLQHDNPSALQHDADIPVRGTDAKEEALKSLCVPGPYTLLPLPVFAYDRNERDGVGTVVPILPSNSKDERHHIYAPFSSHNQYVDETFGLYYYGHPSDTTQYRATVDDSTKTQRDIDLTYKNVGAGDGRYILAGRAAWFKNPFRRLFEMGNQTAERDETTDPARAALVDLTAGMNVNEDVILMWTEHDHDIRIDVGLVTS